ncbi:hypothetical protein EDB85DRAFT_1890855 [Lactarius pseudohatsudake]|nr:hypothetical protein EDB85DRAFT_1890855 [Lactarius pseudohatsudake]
MISIPRWETVRVAQGLGGVKRCEVSRRPPRGASGRMRIRGGRGRVGVEGLEPRASAAMSGEGARSVDREWSQMVAHASARRETSYEWPPGSESKLGNGVHYINRGKWETERSESAAKRASAQQSAQVRSKARKCAAKRASAQQSAQVRSKARKCAAKRASAQQSAQVRSKARKCAAKRASAQQSAQVHGKARKCAAKRTSVRQSAQVHRNTAKCVGMQRLESVQERRRAREGASERGLERGNAALRKRARAWAVRASASECRKRSFWTLELVYQKGVSAHQIQDLHSRRYEEIQGMSYNLDWREHRDILRSQEVCFVYISSWMGQETGGVDIPKLVTSPVLVIGAPHSRLGLRVEFVAILKGSCRGRAPREAAWDGAYGDHESRSG